MPILPRLPIHFDIKQSTFFAVLALLLFCIGWTSGMAQPFASFSPTSGNTGTQVTLSDSRFVLGNVSGVAFNGITAAFFVQSSGTILTQVPAGATTGLISVSSPSGPILSAAPFVISLPTPVIMTFAPTTGASGTPVNISGQNFSNVVSVTFNGVADPSFVVNGATSIVATVPQGATTGPIVVTTSIGADTSTLPFVIVALPVPEIISFSPGSGIAGQTTVSIQGRNFLNPQPITGLTFNGVSVTVGGIISDTEIEAEVPSGATTGPIRITSALGSATSTTNFIVTGQRNDICYTRGPRQDTFSSVSLQPQRYLVRSGNAAFVKLITQAGQSYRFSTCNNPAGLATELYVYDRFGALLTSNAGFGTACPNSPLASVVLNALLSDTVMVSITGIGCSAVSANIWLDYQQSGPAVATRLTPSSGPEGTVVRMSGRNLANGVQVIFNQQLANILSVADTAIVFEIPTPATTGLVFLFDGQVPRSTNLQFIVCTNAAPTISAVGSNFLCQGQTITLQGPANATSYSWSTGQTSRTITLNQPGSVTLQITTGGGCLSTISAPFNIRQRPTPNAVLTQRNDTLFASPANATYRWLVDGVLQNAFVRTLKAQTSGNYQVIVTQNGCSDTSAIFAISSVPNNMGLAKNAIRLVPNPATSTVSIQFNQSLGQPTDLLVFNSLGFLCVKQDLTVGTTEQSIDLSGLSKGVYMIKVGGLVERLVVR